MATTGAARLGLSAQTLRPHLRARWLAGVLIVAGVGIRVSLMRHYNDDQADLAAIANVTGLLTHHFLHAYRGVIGPAGGPSVPSWTYPAGLFPLWIADHVFVRAGISLRTLIAIPNFAADIAMAGLLYRYLEVRRGVVYALAGCAVVSLGWPFFLTTAVMNQVDSLGTLLALAAVMLWSSNLRHRVLLAGLCLGIDTSIKLPFGFMVLALLPTCEDWRDFAQTIGLVIGVPILVTAPFLIADFHHVRAAVQSNHGLPGFAGWTLFVEPAFRHVWLDQVAVRKSAALTALTRWQPEIVLAVLLPLGAVLRRFRVNAVRSAAIVALALWVANTTPRPVYLVWLLPFLVLDEQLWASAAILVVGFFPAVQMYLMNPHPPAEDLYVPIMAALQAVIVAALAANLVAVVRNSGSGALLGLRHGSPPVPVLPQES